MYTEIINFILQPILGAAAGYITNDYAINMLFKSYTPLKIGGVIPKTRDEFIQNINDIIENEILSKEKIQSILENETFVNNFNNLISDVFTNAIYKTVSDKPLKDIDGYNDFIISLNNLIDNNENIIKNSISNISAEININSILTNKQVKYFSSSIYDKLLEIISNTDICDKISTLLQSSFADISISDLTDEDKVNSIISNIVNCTVNKENIQILLNDKNITTELLNNINLYDLMYDLFCTIINKNKKTISQFTTNLIESLTQTDEFKAVLNQISSRLISIGLDCQINIYDLVDKTSFDNVKQYLVINQETFINPIMDFVDNHATEIKLLLKETVEDTINDMDSSKKALVGMGKGAILNKIEKVDIRQFVGDYLKNSGNIDKLLDILTLKAEDYAKSITLSDLTKQLIGKNLVRDNNFTNFINNYLQTATSKFVVGLIGEPDKILKNSTIKTILNDKINSLFINLLTSEKLLKSLNLKVYELIKSYTSRDLPSILNHEGTQNFNFTNFMYKFMADNKQANISYIESTLLNLYKDKTLYDMSDYIGIDKLSDIIKNKTQDYVNKKIGEKTTTTHDLLNHINKIDNIQSKTSTKILSTTKDKLGETLHTFVKSLSETNLKKLNDDELCTMAKGFIGNNLKPIMYFGGLLGFVAGIALSFVKTGTNIFAPFTALNALIFSLVGVATNAIAINMLFRPYKEIKFLRHIPFFRHFSLGYIAKNKTVLANSMANVIDEYLLSNESVNDIYEKGKDKAKVEVIDKLSENNYKAVNDFLSKNKDYIVNATSEKLNQYMCDNIDLFRDTLINQVKAINLIDFSDLAKEKIINSSDNINNTLSDKLASKLYQVCKEEKCIPDKNANFVIKFVCENYIENISKYLNDETEKKLKNLILSLDNTYIKITNKNIESIIDKTKIENIIKSLSDNAKSLFNSTDLNNKINDRIISKINLILKNNKPIGDMLNSSIASKIEYTCENFFNDENLNGKLSKVFLGFSNNVTVTVQNKIKSGLNFLTKGLYSMVGGDDIIEKAVYKFMSNKLPNFLALRKEELYQSVDNMLKENFFKTNISELGISVSNDLNIRIYDNINLEGIFNSDLVDKSLDVLYNKYSDIKSILSPLNIDSIQNIYDFYGEDIDNILSKFMDNLKDGIEKSKDTLLNLTKTKGKEVLSNLSTDKIFCEIDKVDIDSIAKKICDKAISIDNVSALCSSLNDCISRTSIDTNICQFIDIDEFRSDFKNLLEDLLHNKSIIYDNILDATGELYSYLQSDNFSIINSDLRVYIINNVTEALLLSLSKNLPTILKDINFDVIVKEQINNMSPKMIHKMFNSFAGKYFRRLMIYGLFGVVFGINIYVGALLSISYGIKNIIEYKRK